MVKILQAKNSILDKQGLERHLEQMASDNILTTYPDKLTFPIDRIEDNKKYIELVYNLLEQHVRINIPIHPAGEWLLDNYYIIEKSIKTIEKNLKLKKYMNLPAVSEEGFARIYVLSNEIISNTDGKINEDDLVDYLNAYQKQKNLNMQEIWDIDLFLQICILERIRNIAEKIFITQMQRYKAQNVVNRFIEKKREKKLNIDINSRYSFIEFLSYKLRQYGRISIPYIDTLDAQIRKAGMTLDEVISREHFEIALKTLSMKNCIMSLKTIGRINIIKIFEKVSIVEKILKEDPADVYAKMDYSTKSYYRNIILEIAKKTKNSEIYVAQKAIDLCKKYEQNEEVGESVTIENVMKMNANKISNSNKNIPKSYSMIGEIDSDKSKLKMEKLNNLNFRSNNRKICKGEKECEKKIPIEINAKAKEYDEQEDLISLKKKHVGYYLIAQGKTELLSILMNKKIQIMSTQEKAKLFVISTYLISFFITALLSLWTKWVAILLFIPVKNIVNRVIQYNFSKVKKIKILPKMDYQNNIPENARTMCVIPTILNSSIDVCNMMKKMEEYYLANKSENLFFTLLGDCTKSDKQDNKNDKEIINTGIILSNLLNKKYGNKFFFVYRKREWNNSEKCFMGWERKRGLINQYNDFLLGKKSRFKVNTCQKLLNQQGKEASSLKIKYIITLDSDTTLTLDSAFKLIGTMDHILNRPEINKIKNVVVNGHGIIQPRIGINIESGMKSIFSKIFAGNIGTNVYANAISDFYQDNFDEGTFTGKGIYDLKVFNKILRNSIPENKILSHDLIEGSYLRCGLASDILLVDETPSNYISNKVRKERWARGDTQELPWLNSQISLISKYKIKDNIYRNFNNVCIFISYIVLLIQSNKYAYIPLIFVIFPIMLELLDFFILEAKNKSKNKTFSKKYTRVEIAIWQSAIQLITLPDEAFLQLCAFCKSLYRMNISHNFLLEWTTASEAEKMGNNNTVQYYYKNMKIQIYVALLIISFISLFTNYTNLGKLLIYTLGILWILSPKIMRDISKNTKDNIPKKEEEKEYLLNTAKKTWNYFKENQINNLPADNYQEDRKEKIAMRTSPTNIGFSLMSAIASYDLQFENIENTIDFIEKEIDTIEILKKWNGHLYNWYDIKNMQPLAPYDISTVDSGNFVGYLFTVKAFLLSLINENYYINQNETNQNSGYVVNKNEINKGTNSDKNQNATSQNSGYGVNKNEINKGSNNYINKNETNKNYLKKETNLKMLEKKEIDTENPIKSNEKLTSKIINLAEKITQLINDTDFSKLYSEEIGLFSIGYNTIEGKLYDAYYDILASEARQTSLIAIAKKDVPTKHWANLGRTLTSICDYRGLVSWGGTTFEYLMPNIIIPTYKGTLLDESSKLLVYSNISYAKKLGVPWGISESAYSVKDLYGNYQYKTFGIPWLGLKRGLEDDIVISPYSTALSLQIDFKDAVLNLKKLEKEKLTGKYGFYDAIDYKANKEVVKTFMAHHQGMILTSIDNALNQNIFQKRFFSNPEISGTKILLEENMPDDEIVTKDKKEKVHKFEYDGYKEEKPRKDGYNVISKNAISNVVKEDGKNCTKYENIVINKDLQIFVKNINSNKIYDVSEIFKQNDSNINTNKKITKKNTKTYKDKEEDERKIALRKKVEFTPYNSKFYFKDGNLQCSIDTTIAPDVDIEVKKIKIKNTGINDLNLEITTLENVILSSIRQYNSHPAFDKMFLRFFENNGNILIERKSRMQNENCVFVAKTLYAPEEKFEYELDKEKIVRRENIEKDENIDLKEIIKNSPQFSSKVQNIVNPIMAMRKQLKIKKGEKCELYYLTSIGLDKEETLKALDMYKNKEKLDRVFELEKNQMKSQIRYMGLTENEISKYQDMLVEIFKTNQEIFDNKMKENSIERNYIKIPTKMNLANSELWKYGISVDFPIIVFEISNKNNLYYLKKMLKAFEYWKTINVKIELVVISKLNIIDELINEKMGNYLNKRSGIFVIDNISVNDKKMLEMRACKVIDIEKGDIV